MHIKRMHEMIEKLSECALSELNKGIEHVDTKEFGAVIGMIRGLSDAEYKARISKGMECAEKEDEAEEKYMMRMLKDEYKDEYSKYRDMYGEEADKRFYDSWRHSDGTFARKGTGEYRPKSYYRRRGYAEPLYHMPLEMYHNYTPEELRDMDRNTRNVMYFSEPIKATEAHNVNDGRSWKTRRGYMESKEMHKANTPEDKQRKMRDLEAYAKELAEDVTEMITDMSSEEKTLLRTKMQALAQRIQ